MGAVVLTSYYLHRRFGKPLCVMIQCLAWFFGLAWGLLHLKGNVGITPIAIVDASVVSALCILLPWRFGSEKVYTS
jgi:hypothetical protein